MKINLAASKYEYLERREKYSHDDDDEGEEEVNFLKVTANRMMYETHS